ncbi:putative disease resistance protein RGA3 [Glycine soja]|uniref:Putative disease resistance protein RGA1 isoform A n=1 Tax=Glycine soja TaxID=3848 RepID=A0A445LBT2_GLYSO|nr:putative disease resistance protein RGA3 [Glycine soja]KHN07375.1 Putative disease resistance protein RGA1 [Glycine soja]RZC20547.1 putative disease resistance protein RGA1 isoform A [Glycine soja]
MAESFLFSIAESLLSKLASQAYEEASRVLGLYDHLKNLKDTLSLVQAVLLDADQKQEKNHELRVWLRQLKRVFFDAENVLDEFECQTLQNQVVKAHGTTKDKVSHFLSTSNPLVFRYKMAQQIKDISMRLDKVAVDRHKFGLQPIDVDTRVVHVREWEYSTHSHVDDSDVIGREQDKAEIIELLMQQNPNDDHKSLSVIPIVGMGGLGKTTLAKFVFNDKKIDECFPLKMWVSDSDDFDLKQLIIKIINSANANDSVFLADAPDGQKNLSKMGLETLQNQLRHKLADQKFLLVLDGVWKEDRVKWVELRNLIHVGAAAGSKILVTTRSHSIASMMGTVSSHILEGLSLEDSLSLFVRWAFNEGEEKKYPRLIKIGREIVKKCRGVPLALRTLGSLLFPKYDTIQWEDVRDNEIWYLPQKKDDILPALKVSYDLMPSYLRQCFALFSLYPKDYKFYSYDVIQLWGALGFLASPKNNRAQDDIAIQYLWELFSRSLLQDFVSHGTYYSFCLHDLVHDLALFVAKDDCLLVNSHIQSIPESIQHLSFVEKDFHGKSLTTKAVGVRTIFYPDAGAEANFKAYKYLRILHLTNSTFETLPPFIGKLKHLRCLNLRNNKKIKRLPDSICKLQNLQFLFLDGCTELETLPKSLRKLISLYNFEITTKQAVLPENEIANLSYLQYLTIGYCDNVESLFSGIEFPVLKALSVWCCKRLKSLPLDSKHFPALETLHVRYCDKLELFKGHEDQNFYSKLKEVGFWEMPQLEILPHWVQGCANTLLSLHLSYCFNLEVLPDWLPMLTNLRVLDIELCPKLRSLPDGMHCLTALEHLRIKDCRELCIKYKPQVGECWDQISHIKQITIDEQEIWMKR